MRLKGREHRRNIETTMHVLTMDNDEDLNEMSVESFLMLTKHGKLLSIIDGYVIDIGRFIDVHPGEIYPLTSSFHYHKCLYNQALLIPYCFLFHISGGSNVLRFAVGTDITAYFIGSSGINGQKHQHSQAALRALRPLVKWKLENESKEGMQGLREQAGKGRTSFLGRTSIFGLNPLAGRRRPTILGHVFRNATVVENNIVSDSEKVIIRLRLSVKRDHNLDTIIGTPLPTTTFIFRTIDSQGHSIERHYTPSQCFLMKSEGKPKKQTGARYSILPLYGSRKKAQSADVIVYEFFVSIIPGGKMTSILAKKQAGKEIIIMGPLANKVSKLHSLLLEPFNLSLLTQ